MEEIFGLTANAQRILNTNIVTARLNGAGVCARLSTVAPDGKSKGTGKNARLS